MLQSVNVYETDSRLSLWEVERDEIPATSKEINGVKLSAARPRPLIF